MRRSLLGVPTGQSSTFQTLFLLRNVSLRFTCSVMSFVGYDYQKQKERQPSEEWTSLTEEELPDGGDF